MERRSYAFWVTWGLVINDRILIFWLNYPFNKWFADKSTQAIVRLRIYQEFRTENFNRHMPVLLWYFYVDFQSILKFESISPDSVRKSFF